jgi:hypothetical protein
MIGVPRSLVAAPRGVPRIRGLRPWGSVDLRRVALSCETSCGWDLDGRLLIELRAASSQWVFCTDANSGCVDVKMGLSGSQNHMFFIGHNIGFICFFWKSEN